MTTVVDWIKLYAKTIYVSYQIIEFFFFLVKIMINNSMDSLNIKFVSTCIAYNMILLQIISRVCQISQKQLDFLVTWWWLRTPLYTKALHLF